MILIRELENDAIKKNLAELMKNMQIWHNVLSTVASSDASSVLIFFREDACSVLRAPPS